MSQTRKHILSGFSLLSVAILLGSTSGRELEDIIANVVASEAIYKNIEFDCRESYSLARDTNTEYGSGIGVIQREKKETHLVVQGDMHRGVRNGSTETTDGESLSIDDVSACDGEMTRSRSNGVVNLIENPTLSMSLLTYPHESIFANHAAGLPLSHRLQGLDVSGSHTHAVYEGDDTLEDGSRCVRIRIEMWVDGQEQRDDWLLWLRPDRNYLPANAIVYKLKDGKILNSYHIDSGTADGSYVWAVVVVNVILVVLVGAVVMRRIRSRTA